MPQPIAISGRTFPSKGAAKKFFGEIRECYADGVRLDSDDDGTLRGLLACHPEAMEKIGAGIAYFCVETDAVFGRTRHFVVHRSDGSSTDFSFRACIDGRNDRRDRLEALRRAVKPQIVVFRDRCFATNPTPTCPLRGVSVTRAAYHVDHQPPLDFQSLVDIWLRAEAIRLDEVQITAPGDNQIVATMTDNKQVASWCELHQRRAILRLLSPRGNLSDAKVCH
ncbi:MAG: DCL family protein [Opitutaceae bacterium]|nr:DCL family protein [Opitutaceae bacterium]